MSEKWWDMSDDELDDLFREASDKAEIPFDSSALDKLRQKIDIKSMPQPEPKQGFKKRWIALASLLIFFGVVLLYTFFNKSNKSIERKQAEISNTKIKHEKNWKKLGNLSNNQKSEVIVDENNSSKIRELKGNSTNTNVNESEIARSENSTTVANLANKTSYAQNHKKGTKRDYSLRKKPVRQELANGILTEHLLKNKQLDSSNTKPTDKKMPTAVSELSNDNSIVTEKSNTNKVNSHFSKVNNKQLKFKKSKINGNQASNPSIYSEKDVSISTPTNIPDNKLVEEETIIKTNFYKVNFLPNKETKPLQTNIASESPTYVDAPPILIKQPKFSRFGIRLAIAPEINSIERMESSAVVGSMFALLIEYRLTKKLTLQSGVNYSKKNYTGNFDYYRAWTSGTGTKPLSVDGICSVVDIPVNLRLNAFQMNRNTFFVNGGISSYIISDEIYSYNYAWGPPKVRDWTGSSSSFYWSTLNLSVGVERKMNKHFTLQVEPFLKTPLVGVGRGLVNLYSSGILFSTKYEF